jgi:hypothetical protein
VLEHVLNLGGAVKRELREAVVQRAHDRHGVAPAVEEVGIAEGDVARTHAREALDVAQNGLGLHDADTPVIDRGNRAVAAVVHAPVAGLHVPDQPLLPADRQAGVALQSRQLARGKLERAALEVNDRPVVGPRRRVRRHQPVHHATSAGSYSPAT